MVRTLTELEPDAAGSRLSLNDRQSKQDARAAAGRALRPDPPGVRVDNTARDEQAQPEATAIVLVNLREPLEHRFDSIGRDARALVAYRDLHLIVDALGAQQDAGAARAELDRVTNQVAEHLEE